MRHIFRSRPVLTEAAHRATMFEIFFDLVLVLTLIRLVAFMGEPPTFLSMAQGLLGLAITVCLWWLFFENAAAAASQALARATGTRRDKIASDAYSLGLFPLIAGVIYLALGIEQVLAHLARNQPQHPAGEPLSWTSATALYGGVVLYLTGRLLFLRLAARSAPPAQLAAAGVALLLLPAARALPALAALGLLTAFLIALVCYERLTQGSEAVVPPG